jgi:hypothetical protein
VQQNARRVDDPQAPDGRNVLRHDVVRVRSRVQESFDVPVNVKMNLASGGERLEIQA